MFNKLLLITLLYHITYGQAFDLSIPTILPPSQNKVKVGKVSAGPIEISALGCGTWSWGNRLLWDYDPSQDEEIYSAYKSVRDADVTLFDTADSYGTLDLNGRAEILLGEFEKRYLMETEEEWKKKEEAQSPSKFFGNMFSSSLDSSSISKQQVATKFAPYPWRVFPSSMTNAAKESLSRLGQNKLALAQLHWSTANYQPFQERALWEGIGNVYDEGLCDAIGVSNYGPQQLQKIASYMEEREVPLATAQIQYSLMTYKDCRDMNQICDDQNVRLISYSPLCLGLLTGKYDMDNLPRQGNPRRQLFREILPGAKPLLDTLGVMAKDLGKSQSQISINWAICKGTVPIPGARTLRQAKENLGSVDFRLSSDMVEELDRVASNIDKPMIQNVFQTK